jgi:hypothetical protein
MDICMYSLCEVGFDRLRGQTIVGKMSSETAQQLLGDVETGKGERTLKVTRN